MVVVVKPWHGIITQGKKKTHQCLIGHLLLKMKFSLKKVCFHSETIMEEIKFSFASGYGLQFTFG